MLFPRLLKLADVATVQGSHDADAREHRRAAKLILRARKREQTKPTAEGGLL